MPKIGRADIQTVHCERTKPSFGTFSQGEKVATLSRSLVRFCRFLLEKDTEMNEKRNKLKTMMKVEKFHQISRLKTQNKGLERIHKHPGERV